MARCFQGFLSRRGIISRHIGGRDECSRFGERSTQSIRPWHRRRLWTKPQPILPRLSKALQKNKPEYVVTLDDVMEAHDRALQFGGRPGVLSRDLILSAIARPYTGYYSSVAEKCAAFVQSLAGNHGFTDGNKRTTLYIVDLYIRRSGYHLAGSPLRRLNQDLERIILSSAAGEFDRSGTIRWFEDHLHLRGLDEA
jgi:death on curing protein